MQDKGIFNIDCDIKDLKSIEIEDFIGLDWVKDDLRDIWVANYSENRDRIFPLTTYYRKEKKCCVLVGSSSAIKNQVSELKRLSNLNNFVIIACNGVYKWLVENDITPDYVFLVEGRDHVLSDLDSGHAGITLVVSPFVDPKVFDIWEENIEVYVCGGGEKFDKLLKEDFEEIDVTGGNVTNTSFLWSYKYLGCRDYIVVGTSLCYKDKYYFDGRSTDNVMKDLNANDHINAVDIYGNVVKTTAPLLLYKSWLETYSKLSGANFINATEDGILGVYPEPVEYKGENLKYKLKFLPWMSISPLGLAIDAYFNMMEEKN